MNQDLDLTDIDPLKWAEVRRRSRVVNEYLKHEKRTAADRQRFAAMLDLGSAQFMNLVKAWQAQRDATSLAPGMRRAKISRSRREGVDPSAREIAREVISDLGPAGALRELVAETNRRCVAVGLKPPSRGTTWLLSQEAKGRGVDGEPESVVVARAYLRLPVNTGRSTTFPEVIVAAEMHTGRIIELAMTRPGGDFDARRVAGAIERRAPVDPLPIIGIEADAKALMRYLPSEVPVRCVSPARATRALSDTLGTHVGLLVLSFRSPTIPPATMMRSGLDRAPNLDDAELALHIARERHNAALAVVA